MLFSRTTAVVYSRRKTYILLVKCKSITHVINTDYLPWLIVGSTWVQDIWGQCFLRSPKRGRIFTSWSGIFGLFSVLTVITPKNLDVSGHLLQK